QRLQNLPPYIFATIAEKLDVLRTTGAEVIRLDIGNPDMPPPPHVIEKLREGASNTTKHGYSGYRGVATFREAVAEHYQRRYDVSLDPDKEVLPLLGSKEGIVNLTSAFVDVGDCVLVPEIGYPAYMMATRLCGGNLAWVKMDPDQNYLPILNDISEVDASGAKLMWVNYPNNPTGGIATQEDYAAMVDFCRRHDVLLASDNPYVDVMYEQQKAGSVLQADPALNHTVEFMSFSKSYNMAGWRLGAAVGNPDALKHLLHIKSNMDSGHFKAIYDAGTAALLETPDAWIAERNAIYERRRDLILDALPSIGLEAPHKPMGAMYIWARRTNGKDTSSYIDAALEQAHVSLAPGAAYGPGGEGYIRLSVGLPDDEIARALERLAQWYTVWSQ
ncbi:MAG: aminotransferase class I/II-fold pyridoxal phosphate-dependent enzyme, partial [Chloroflexota bacterium]